MRYILKDCTYFSVGNNKFSHELRERSCIFSGQTIVGDMFADYKLPSLEYDCEIIEDDDKIYVRIKDSPFRRRLSQCLVYHGTGFLSREIFIRNSRGVRLISTTPPYTMELLQRDIAAGNVTYETIQEYNRLERV